MFTRKKRVTTNGAARFEVQPTSYEDVQPPPPFDLARLHDRLLTSAHMAPCFQENVVITILSELREGSQGLLRVHLTGSQSRSGVGLSTPNFTSPVHWAGRMYGSLLVAPDPMQPTRPCLSFGSATSLALTCAVLFYSLEVSALLQGGGSTSDIMEKALTRREQEVLALLCQRYERKIIAEQLHITYSTVGKHCEHIFSHLGVHSDHEAILAAFHREWYYPLASLTPQVNMLSSQ